VLGRFTLGAAMTIVVSIAVYRCYEAPARRAVRAWLGRSIAVEARKSGHWLIVAAAVGPPVALSAVGWYISLR